MCTTSKLLLNQSITCFLLSFTLCLILDLVEAVKKKFVFQIGNRLLRDDFVQILEKAAGQKVSKVQAFNLAQTLGKIEKTTCRTCTSRKNGVDNRVRK